MGVASYRTRFVKVGVALCTDEHVLQILYFQMKLASLLANLAVKIQWIFIENSSLHMKITWKNKSLHFQWDFKSWCNVMKTIWIFKNMQHPMKMSWKPLKKYYSIEHPMKMLSKSFEKHFPVHHPNGDPLKMLWIFANSVAMPILPHMMCI